MEPPSNVKNSPPFFVEFLKRYRDSPSLWNPDCAEYHDKRSKDESINALIDVCKKHNLEDSSRSYVLRKIYSTRMAFRKELTKLERLKYNKSRGTRHRALWYFKHMEFLKDSEMVNLGFVRPKRPAPTGDDTLRTFDGYSFKNDGQSKAGSLWRCIEKNCRARVLLYGSCWEKLKSHNHSTGNRVSSQREMIPSETEYVECDVDLDNMVTTEENDTKPIITPQITGDSVVTEIATTSRPQRMSNRNNIYEDAEVDEELEDTGSQIQIQAEPCFELAPPCLSEASKDECDIYGQLISAKLKKMDDRTRDIAMHKIDNVLFNMKMNPIRDE